MHQHLIQVLAKQSELLKDEIAFTFISNGGRRRDDLSFGQLHERASNIAIMLRERVGRGERAILLYPSGLEFVTAFFGCLYAEIIAVPAYPPHPVRPEKTISKVGRIARDCDAKLILTTPAIAQACQQEFQADAALKSSLWVTAEMWHEASNSSWMNSDITAQTIAMLQYTSGSTGTPKGVVLTHGNLLHNQNQIRIGLGLRGRSEIYLSWLPLYHDMGLIGHVIAPVCHGSRSIIMAPLEFLNTPFLWLEALGTFRATVSGAPNFAWELCSQRVSYLQLQHLDLSSWCTAYNGSEPIRADTLRTFLEKFRSCGFRQECIVPCYGLAESSLIVTGGRSSKGFVTTSIPHHDLIDRASVYLPSRTTGSKEVVGCGRALGDELIAIVDPATCKRARADCIGEVWVSSASVALGYWGQPETSEHIFHAVIEGEQGSFLRTGDLGFVDENGELFLTGRLKDLIVVDGRNVYPQDLERAAEDAHLTIRVGYVAAFPVTVDGSERAVLVAEVMQNGRKKDVQLSDVIQAIRLSVLSRCDVALHAVVLGPPGTVPKGTSGKLQRYACRDLYERGKLNALAVDTLPRASSPRQSHNIGELRHWFVRTIANRIGIDAEKVDQRKPLAEYGLGSRDILSIAGELGARLGEQVPPTILWEHATVDALFKYFEESSTDHRNYGSLAPVRVSDREPIAIVGIGCRFPGANGLAEFWNLLRQGIDATSAALPSRWKARPSAEEAVIARGGFIDPIDMFDANFFRISPREAMLMDPQQRLLLEVAWEALEDAGQSMESLEGSLTGVFVGVCGSEYGYLQARATDRNDIYVATGSSASITANRLSYAFDLHGPSVAVDTACSSSLVAVHLACESLYRGDATLALAGGVNVLLLPQVSRHLAKAGLLSLDGRCKAFGAAADGYGRGEGAGIVVLKPLSRALADGDRIVAVLRATVVAHDGRTNGLTAPSLVAQRMLLRSAYDRAGLSPHSVQYVEAHGTGTAVGDLIEATAIGEVCGSGRRRPCAIGSVKSNIGHLEAAAGVAGLVKVALALQAAQLPPTLHAEALNPEIPFEELGLAVQTRLETWPDEEEGGQSRLAGVSSFGFGGTIAHVVLEQAPIIADRRPSTSGSPCLIPISTRDPDALPELALRYADLLRHASTGQLQDIARSAAQRRSHHEVRAAVVGSEGGTIADALTAFAADRSYAGVTSGIAGVEPSKVVFVFSGQGSQWRGMGRSLLDREPVFRNAVDRLDVSMRPFLGRSLRDLLPLAEERPSIEIIQPALFAMAIALAELWRDRGIEPAALVGHSVGEVAAAYVAGVLSAEEAALVVCVRSRLLTQLQGKGGMVLVGLGEEEVRRRLRATSTGLSVAALNGCHLTVLAGELDALDRMVHDLQAEGVFCRTVDVDVGSHSSQVVPLLAPIRDRLQTLAPQPGRLPILSTVTGDWLDGRSMTAEYWARNLRDPVLFAPAIRKLVEQGFGTFVEISPHPILVAAVEDTLADYDRTERRVAIGTLRRGRDEQESLLESLSALYVRGHTPRWRQIYGTGPHVSLPIYPWRRARFPIELDGEAGGLSGASRGFTVFNNNSFVWEITVSRETHPHFADHIVNAEVVVPMSGILQFVLEAARAYAGVPQRLLDVKIRRLMPLGEGRRVQVTILRAADGSAMFDVASRDLKENADDTVVHADGKFGIGHVSRVEAEPPSTIRARHASPVRADELYGILMKLGMSYGPQFRAVREAWYSPDEALGKIGIDRMLGGAAAHAIAIDAGMQVAALCLGGDADGAAILPTAVEDLEARSSYGMPHWVHASVRNGPEPIVDVRVLGDDGELLCILERIRFTRIEKSIAETKESRFLRQRWFRQERHGVRSIDHRWLVISDAGGFAQSLKDKLEERGDLCEVVADDSTEPEGVTEERRLQAQVAARAGECTDVVYLRTLDSIANPSAHELLDLQICGSFGALCVAQGLTEPARTSSPRLWIVTRSTRAVRAGDLIDCAAAPVWGIARSLAREHPSMRCTCIDIDGSTTAGNLSDELCAGSVESQVALRGADRYVARLEWHAATAKAALPAVLSKQVGTDHCFALESDRPGMLDALRWRAAERKSPERGQVEIAVRAAGLNFRDVLMALGQCPGISPAEPCRFDAECAGVVVSVGDGVAGYTAGDEVVAIARAGLGSHVCVDARRVLPKPAGLSFNEAAALPIAFGTAQYALSHVARLASGERVLIHAATGGVGLASIQIARGLGADIFATAGSLSKRDLLARLGLQHVMDSRTLAFADGVLRATGGEGVDVVVNSLAGEFMTKSIDTLRPFGRFIELGKRDIYGNGAISLSPFRRNLTFSAVDVEWLVENRADFFFGTVLGEIWQAIRSGRLAPIEVRAFPVNAVEDAFRHMALAKHIGKVVLSFAGSTLEATESRKPLFRPDASYLVTGGLGGLGLAVGSHMVDRGVRHLAIVSRSAPGPNAQASLELMRRKGAKVMVECADVSDEAGLARALERFRGSMPELRGIVHAAGVLEDAMLPEQDRMRYLSVMRPKLQGAWNLHRLTMSQPVDFFVLFSSAAALLGSPGQLNYAAANSFLDALAEHRNAIGLPALSLQWGPWRQVGYVSGSDHRAARLDGIGVGAWRTREALEQLERAMENCSGVLGAIRLDLRELLRSEPSLAAEPFFAQIFGDVHLTPSESVPGDLREALRAEPPLRRRARLEEAIADIVQRTLRLHGRPDRDVPLGDLGLDSLTALEVRNHIVRVLGLVVPISVAYNNPTVGALTAYLARHLDEIPATSSEASAVSEVADRALESEIAGKSADELARILQADIERLGG